jgi:hypothetical protein
MLLNFFAELTLRMADHGDLNQNFILHRSNFAMRIPVAIETAAARQNLTIASAPGRPRTEHGV